MRRALALLGATVTVALVVAACGGGGGGGGGAPQSKPVSKEELRSMLERADREIGGSFGRVEQAIQKDDPEQLRQALEGAAATERRQIDRLQAVRPPGEAEEPLRDLLQGARTQVAELQRLARGPDLSAKSVEKRFQQPDEADKKVEQALGTLAERGFAPPMN